MKKTNSRIASILLTCGASIVAFACGDDTSGSDPGSAGTSSSEGGTSAGTVGMGSAGKGGNAQAGKNTGGTKNYAGSDGEGGDGGEAEPNAGSGGGGGKGGSGGTAGAGGKGGAGGTAGGGGVSGSAGTSGGGAGGMSGGGAGGTAGGGGTVGGGGTGGSGGPTCGNGVVDDGEACDPEDGKYTEDDCGAIWGTGDGETGASSACKVITPLACLMCEEQSACAELTDSALLMGKTATSGPAMGVKRAVLYNETLDCVRDTKCADGLPIDCYCGTASSSACDAGNGNGKCRAVIERGLETTNPAEIQSRYFALEYGGGLALSRINCDQQDCLAPCFPTTP